MCQRFLALTSGRMVGHLPPWRTQELEQEAGNGLGFGHVLLVFRIALLIKILPSRGLNHNVEIGGDHIQLLGSLNSDVQVLRQNLGGRRARLFGPSLRLGKEVAKHSTAPCLPNLPDCQNRLGSRLKIIVPTAHPKLTESESSGQGPGNPYL